METTTIVAISISDLLVSFTGYALYIVFGQRFNGKRFIRRTRGLTELRMTHLAIYSLNML
jgi:hypothetical protein